MCGIVGFVGENSATAALHALERLDYRGYDSAGIATFWDSRLWIKKDVGNLAQVETRVNLKDMPGSIAIGHTRWATHGCIDVCNAHPHLDCRGRVAVVHNGVIENYQELKSRLQQRGHVFISQTDSEVIPHLIEEFMCNGTPLEVAVSATSAELKGSFAFLAISVEDPGKMVGAKRDNPLVLGVGNGGVFASSDCISFLEHTNELLYVEDGEIPVVRGDDVFFVKEGNGRIQKEPTRVSWQHQDVQKGIHPYFMMKEITEQPQAVRRAVAQDRDVFTELAMDILRANQVIITACGSSRYAALVGRYLFSKIGGKFCDVVMAPEFHYFSDSVDKNTLVIAVSQSGETADVVEGVKRASANGAKVCSIINRDGTILSNLSDSVIQLNVGPEIAVAATKSFSGQLAIFYLLSYAMVNRFSIGAHKIKEVSKAMETVIDYNNGNLEKLAKQLKDSRDFYFIARGTNFAIASEGALKLKEISYIHAEGLPAGELKHGTLALIEKGTPVVVICPKDHTFSETLTNAIEAKSRGAYIIGVSDEENEAYDFWIKIPPVEELFYPMVAVIPLQLLAYHAAVCRGNNPDRPRNLAKSVTVK